MERANHYRLLNEPMQAESICLDVIAIDPQNRQAQVTLLLSLTDQFPSKFALAYDRAKAVLEQLQGEYDKAYYEGIVNERWAAAQLDRGMPTEFVTSWIREALRCYEVAQELVTDDNPDPVLRWNTCVRMITSHTVDADEHDVHHRHHHGRDVHSEFGDDVPMR